MFTDYQEVLVREYREKKSAMDLPENLLSGTLSKLKAECAEVCAKRYLRQDERTLSRYFKIQTDQQGYLDLINSKDPDDFKSVYKFLRGETKKPGEEIVELLAWLIDYQPRPYLRWVNVRSGKEPVKGEEELNEKEVVNKAPHQEKEDGDEKTVIINTLEPKKGRKRLTILISFVVSITFASVLIVWPVFKPSELPRLKPVAVKKSGKLCMSWKSDHYEEVACSNGGVLLDSGQLLHQRRILNPKNSINYASIGHVWYFRTPDSLEYFTAGGAYPLDTNRRLLPITRYMIDHHILPKHVQIIDNSRTVRSK